MVLGVRASGPLSRRKAHVDDPHLVLSGPLRALHLAFQQAEVRKAETYRRGLLPARPTLIEHGPLRFLLSGTPSGDTLPDYANVLLKHNVKHVVRVCEATYDADQLRAHGFHVHDLPFPDGDAPPKDVVRQWLALLDTVFALDTHVAKAAAAAAAVATAEGGSDSDSLTSPADSMDKFTETIAIHCVAGLGRAPVLAALGLVEFGLDPYEAVGWIRALRRGAINARQLSFLEHYNRRPLPLVKPQRSRSRSRSGSIVGSFWPAFKAARPFRPRSPLSAKNSPRSSPIQATRASNLSPQQRL